MARTATGLSRQSCRSRRASRLVAQPIEISNVAVPGTGFSAHRACRLGQGGARGQHKAPTPGLPPRGSPRRPRGSDHHHWFGTARPSCRKSRLWHSSSGCLRSAFVRLALIPPWTRRSPGSPEPRLASKGRSSRQQACVPSSATRRRWLLLSRLRHRLRRATGPLAIRRPWSSSRTAAMLAGNHCFANASLGG